MKTKFSGGRLGAGILNSNPHRRIPTHLFHAMLASLARLLGGRPALDASRRGELSDLRTPVPERGFGGPRDHGRDHGRGYDRFGGGHGHGGHGGHGFGERPAWKGLCVHNCPECALPECVHSGGPKHGSAYGGFAQSSPSRQAQPQPPQSQPWMAAQSEQQTTAPQPAQEQPTQQEESCSGDCRTCPNGVCVKTGRLRAVRPKQ